MRSLIAILLALWLAPAWAQLPMTGAGKGSPAGYIGPGDVFASAYGWYSCARAYSAAKAAALTNLCDLVDSAAPTTVICTLKSKANGYVDLTTASCTGSLTPSSACAAATGGVCNISKVYDQSGNSRDLVNTTAIAQPIISFSSPGGGSLPVINLNGGTNRNVSSASTFTINQPITFSCVLLHQTGGNNGNAFGSAGTAVFLTTSSTQAIVSGGTSLTTAASDNTWYAVQGLTNGNGTSSAINLNGSDTTGAAGTTGFVTQNIRIGRANTSNYGGSVAECGMWNASSTSTDRGNLATNQRSSTYGYNF